MLKIKNYIFNKDKIVLIEPYEEGEVYTIRVTTDNDFEYVVFDSKTERDKELNRLLKVVGDNNDSTK